MGIEAKILSFENVTFAYPGENTPVLKNISLQAQEGSFTAVIGASGSGKTTLFRLLNRFEQPQEGRILVKGSDLKNQGGFTSYMPQQDLLFPWLTVEENAALPMTVRKVPKAERLTRARQMLSQVGLAGWEKRRVSELSGGMRQRAAFARTLCAGGELLLLDEPFSALDSITRIGLQEWLLSQWKELGKTILFITHDVEEAIFLSQRVLVLKGRPVDRIECYEVPLPKERSRDMLLRPEIMALKETLIDQLRQEAGV